VDATQPLTLGEVWRTVRKYWATAVVTALSTVTAVAFFTFGQTRTYQASATIMFDPNPPRPLGKGVDTLVELGTGGYNASNREYFETQYRILQSMRVAMSVVQDLDLQHDASFIKMRAPSAGLPAANVTTAEAAEILRLRLTVEPVKESRLAVVRFDDADPARAQRILSTLVDTYVAQNLDTALESTNSAVDWLRAQLDKLKGDLESNEMALHEFKLDKNILSVAFDDQTNILREEMKQINDTLTHIRTKREEVAARRDELSHLKGDDPGDLPASELLQSSLLQMLRQRYEEARRDRDAVFAAGKGPHHPDAQAAEARVAATRKALLDEVHNIQHALDHDFNIIRKQEGGLAGLLERAKKQALDLNLLEIEFNRLRRSKDNTEKLYQLVLERTKESDLTRMMRINNIHIIDRPLLPRIPIKPRIPVNMIFGAIVGLTLGAAAALFRAILDRTIKTPDDVERDLNVTFLGLLPQIGNDVGPSRYSRRRRQKKTERVGSPDLIVHEHPRSGIAEAARAIRTNLMFMTPDQQLKTLLVTSSSPSEGKTTVACCIAIAMAQAGQRVVLVDCDLRRPRVHRVFKLGSDLGVTSSLLNGPLADDVIRTEVPNLSVIPAGPIPPNAAELFHSEKFRAFLADLTKRFDRVILDTPPVIAVTDAAVLSTFVDGVVLVVRGFKTAKDVARHGLRTLSEVGAKTLGIVLNAIDLDRHEYKYYHYYYRREYYSSDPTSTSSTTSASPPSTSAAAQ
jgi:capsular exopolysaccharide synthesis family protein